MGLFRPFDEEAKPIDHKINLNQKYRSVWGTGINQSNSTSRVKKPDNNKEIIKDVKSQFTNPSDRIKRHMGLNAEYATGKYRKSFKESTTSLLGLTDEDIAAIEEGCNSDTCKCKGGTCPTKVTDGISTSSYAAKKLASAGSNNQTDLNAVKPNAEYSRRNDALFIGDGDSPETSKTNIPAILAAKTAGGAPHGWTTDNGINGTGPNVFKLKKLKDDDDGPNG